MKIYTKIYSLLFFFSTKKDIDTQLTKAWTTIDKLSIIWKSNLTDKMKCSFFQAAVISILLYGCTTWTLTKRLEKKLDSNYTRSSVSSTEKDINTRLMKAWTAINKLSIWKSNLGDKMKRCFFQAAVVSILLYGCTIWTLTKRLEKKLDSKYTRVLWAILNKSWRQHPTRHQLYGHLPPITKTIQVRWTRHARHCWRSRDELISDVLLWTPTYGRAKAGRPAGTYIQRLCEDTDVALKTCQRRWTIGRSGERGSGISMLAAWHDDDDDDVLYIKNYNYHHSSEYFKVIVKILFFIAIVATC